MLLNKANRLELKENKPKALFRRAISMADILKSSFLRTLRRTKSWEEGMEADGLSSEQAQTESRGAPSSMFQYTRLTARKNLAKRKSWHSGVLLSTKEGKTSRRCGMAGSGVRFGRDITCASHEATICTEVISGTTSMT